MSRKKDQTPAKPASGLAQHLVLRLRESAFIVLTPLAIYVLISLVTYEPSDPGWSHSGTADSVRNAGGVVGAWIADVGLLLFGYLAFLFPVMLAWWGWLILRGARDGNRRRASSGCRR